MTVTNDRIEIRMFGRLFVRRSSGDVVDADEWVTGKNADLLRLLALDGNRPVSAQRLINNLWPDVDDDKAKASLRTAASRVRHVLGEACVERSLGGLILHNSWTDVATFQSIVHDIASALRAGDHARVVSQAREAEALFIADFRAYDDRSVWATETRESLRLSRQAMLADAADAALTLRWMRDAIDFATMAIAVDPSFERPHRTLMRAHAALGEIELALRAFEHCRVCLLQELGADPSPQTRALHIHLLSGDAETVSIAPFAGRSDEVQILAEHIRTAVARDGCDVVHVSGLPGSGRESLLQAAVAREEHAHLSLLLQDGTSSMQALTSAGMPSDRRSDVTVWGPADGDPSWEVGRLLTFLSGLDVTVARVVGVVTSPAAAVLLAQRLKDGPVAMHGLTTGPVSTADLLALATSALSGKPTPRLLQELGQESQHLAGRAVALLRDWMAAGWIISTADGLDLYNDTAAMMGEAPVGDYFRITIEQLSWVERELCQLLALIDAPLTAQLVHSVSGEGPDVDELQSQLDNLADLGLLRIGHRGYEFRNRAIRDAFEYNLRPAVRARAQRRIRESLDRNGPMASVAVAALPRC